MKTTALMKLRKQLAALRDAAGDETTLAQALVLLEVSINPGIRMTEVAAQLPTEGTHSLVSRAVDTLANHQGRRTRRQPAGLIERRDVIEDRRAVALHLTKKGEKLMEELTA